MTTRTFPIHDIEIDEHTSTMYVFNPITGQYEKARVSNGLIHKFVRESDSIEFVEFEITDKLIFNQFIYNKEFMVRQEIEYIDLEIVKLNKIIARESLKIQHIELTNKIK